MNWQKNSSWEKWFEITGADGVDFHMIGTHPERGDPIYPGESYTKEEFFKAKTYPRSGYSFWKLIRNVILRIHYFTKNGVASLSYLSGTAPFFCVALKRQFRIIIFRTILRRRSPGMHAE